MPHPPRCLLPVLLLLLAGCASHTSPDDGRATAAAFLDQLRAGQVDAAWQATSSEFKSLLGLDGFRDYVKTHPAATQPAEFAAFTAADRNSLPGGEATFRTTGPKPANLHIQLVKEDAQWRVIGFVVD